MQFKIIHWNQSTSPTLSELHQQLMREGLFLYDWSNSPGDAYTAHAHDYDKIIVVVRGSITWILPETHEAIETQAGDRIELPRGTVHAAQVGARGVTCLEGHVQ